MNAPIGALPPLSNRLVDILPGDTDTSNRRRQVSRACYSLVQPKGFPQAQLLAWSRALGEQLGFSPMTLGEQQFTTYMSGNTTLPGLASYAQCYGGHQFGHWAGQLGDGRAINLGEVIDSNGQHQILQLKGAGPTPYSRTADGLAVMRSSVREFVCSEAMFHLGVPTTRALSLVGTGEQVMRDMFYDGNAAYEPGAIVCRVAPSFLRFGSFEIFTARGELDVLKQVVDFTITRDFPALGKPSPDTYFAWFNEVCQRTATLLVHWMRVGFVHGVMNTDNMSILGLTIDYGPYGWLENYDPQWTPNTTDAQGRRYRFGQQPQIALWNLLQLANAIFPLVDEAEPLEQALGNYKSAYEKQWLTMMRNKLGLMEEKPEDAALVQQLLDAFSHVETDMTLFFRALAMLECEPHTTFNEVPPILQDCWYDTEPGELAHTALLDWLKAWQQRLQLESADLDTRTRLMNRNNPLYVPRNWLLQLAIDEIEQESSTTKLEELMQAFSRPYEEQEDMQHLAQKRPEWARQRAGCSMLSCSS
jgi:serine/tyrosine/threonine adenylyltransferase